MLVISNNPLETARLIPSGVDRLSQAIGRDDKLAKDAFTRGKAAPLARLAHVRETHLPHFSKLLREADPKIGDLSGLRGKFRIMADRVVASSYLDEEYVRSDDFDLDSIQTNVRALIDMVYPDGLVSESPVGRGRIEFIKRNHRLLSSFRNVLYMMVDRYVETSDLDLREDLDVRITGLVQEFLPLLEQMAGMHEFKDRIIRVFEKIKDISLEAEMDISLETRQAFHAIAAQMNGNEQFDQLKRYFQLEKA